MIELLTLAGRLSRTIRTECVSPPGLVSMVGVGIMTVHHWMSPISFKQDTTQFDLVGGDSSFHVVLVISLDPSPRHSR